MIDDIAKAAYSAVVVVACSAYAYFVGRIHGHRAERKKGQP